jgi:hypothetical protein
LACVQPGEKSGILAATGEAWMLAVALLLISNVEGAEVPLPPPRPPIPTVAVQKPHGQPTECDKRLGANAVFELKPSLSGPGLCGAEDLVSLTAVRLPEGGEIAMQPPALLRCEMAEAVSNWVRDEVAPWFSALGGGLAAISQDDAYECRNRNRAADGKISEHAHGLALDVRAFVLADKHVVSPTDVNEPKDLRVALRESACRRFTTVLGPGQPAHDSHIHVDIIERRGGYRICAWDVREPMLAKATIGVPLPRPRPAMRSTSGAR